MNVAENFLRVERVWKKISFAVSLSLTSSHTRTCKAHNIFFYFLIFLLCSSLFFFTPSLARTSIHNFYFILWHLMPSLLYNFFSPHIPQRETKLRDEWQKKRIFFSFFCKIFWWGNKAFFLFHHWRHSDYLGAELYCCYCGERIYKIY